MRSTRPYGGAFGLVEPYSAGLAAAGSGAAPVKRQKQVLRAREPHRRESLFPCTSTPM